MHFVGLNGLNNFVRTAMVSLVCLSAAVVSTSLLSEPVHAQTSANVDVKGNERIATSTILAVIADDLSGELSDAKINDAVQSLNATGFFKTVEISRSGGGLVIEVAENPTINLVEIEGNKRIKDDVLITLVQSQSRQTYSASRAESDANAIAKAYADAGRISATVVPRVIERSQNRVDLVFTVVEGNVSEIEKITFVGNRNFKDRRLRSVIETKQAGFFRTFVSRDTFIQERLEADKQVLRDFYLRNGYVDFRVLSASAELTREKDGFLVTYSVQEGQQYSFGETTVTSTEDDINADAFVGLLKRIKTGSDYDPRRVDAVTSDIDARAAQLNYSFVRVTPNITRNDEDRALDINFEITRGPRQFIERIDIEGNSTTLDKVIRRQFRVAEGDPFNQREVQEAADRIRALGYFENVSVSSREGSSASRAVIDVNVVEKPTGNLNFGLGYSSTDGVSGGISIEERNFLGRGQTVRASVQQSADSTTIGIGFEEPAFLDRDLLVGFDISGDTTSSSFLPTNIDSISFRPRVAFPTGEFGRLTLFYSLGQYDIQIREEDDGTGTDTDVPVDASALTLSEVGKSVTSAIGFTYAIDKRNSPITPTAGYRLSFTQEFAGLGGDEQFSKSSVSFKTYRALLNEEVILSAEVEGGYIRNFGDQGARINNRFFLGGDQLRGFESFGIGPRDQSTEDAVGGNAFAVARLEASFPIGLPREYGIYGGIFFDAGSVWGIDDNKGADFAGEDKSAKIRSAIGVSIFWDTAIGPLRFNFAKPLEYESYDETETFRFTIDTRF